MSLAKPWKALERRHAKRMRGDRIWRQDFSEVAPDGENEFETWDAKCYQRHAAISLFADAEKKYRAYSAGRRFHLVLFARTRKGAGDFVLLRAKDYAADQAILARLRSQKTAARDDDGEEWS